MAVLRGRRVRFLGEKGLRVWVRLRASGSFDCALRASLRTTGLLGEVEMGGSGRALRDAHLSRKCATKMGYPNSGLGWDFCQVDEIFVAAVVPLWMQSGMPEPR